MMWVDAVSLAAAERWRWDWMQNSMCYWQSFFCFA
jgi:hypothetical protein